MQKEDIKSIDKRKSTLTKALEQLDENLQSLREKEEKLRDGVVQQRQQIETARSSVQAAATRDELIKCLFAERDSGRIPGIFVRLNII